VSYFDCVIFVICLDEMVWVVVCEVLFVVDVDDVVCIVVFGLLLMFFGCVFVVVVGMFDGLVVVEVLVMVWVYGVGVECVDDVGVVGLYWLFVVCECFDEVDVFVVVVGMEGVLVSVVGGLIGVLFVVVFIFIGYGMGVNGLVVLLLMLNFCVLGIVVVNVDNGYGVGVYVVCIVCWV